MNEVISSTVRGVTQLLTVVRIRFEVTNDIEMLENETRSEMVLTNWYSDHIAKMKTACGLSCTVSNRNPSNKVRRFVFKVSLHKPGYETRLLEVEHICRPQVFVIGTSKNYLLIVR